MIATGYNGYKSTIVNTTRNKEEILLLLYEKVLVSLKFARRGIETNNPKQKGENISRALAILTEFDCALDREIGGVIAENLAAIYSYATERLTVASIQNDPEVIREVERVLGELYLKPTQHSTSVSRISPTGSPQPLKRMIPWP